MTPPKEAPVLTDEQADAIIRSHLDKFYPTRDRNLDSRIRPEYRDWVRAAYAAGLAAASPAVPKGTTHQACPRHTGQMVSYWFTPPFLSWPQSCHLCDREKDPSAHNAQPQGADHAD